MAQHRPLPSHRALAADHAGAPWSRIGDDSLHDGIVNGEEFADLVSLAARMFGVPIATLGVGHGQGLRVLAQQGLASPAPVDSALLQMPGPETPRLLVADAHADPRFRDDPIVAGAPGVRFFLGVALTAAGGGCPGVLGLADTTPRRNLPADCDAMLGQLGRLAGKLLERHQLQRRNRIAAQIMQADFSAVVVVDGQGGVVFFNRAAEAIFGSHVRGVRGMPVELLFPAHLQSDPQAALDWLRDTGNAAPAPAHLRALGRNGAPRMLEAARCEWRISQGRGRALILRDVTEQLAQQDQLRHAALYDPLTGLGNRNGLAIALARQLRPGARPLGLALLGLDNFKAINDTLGHRHGDAALQAVATRLQTRLPAGASVARAGGDEFAIIYPDVDADALQRELTRVLTAVRQPYEINAHQVHLDASVGLAIFDRDDEDDAVFDGNDLIARADLALYKAKAAGGRQCCRFEMDMRREVNARRMLDLELRRAVAQDEFELHYQPQMDLASGLPFGAEALLRWRHPEHGLLSPAAFIDALATSPLAADVGRWIIQQACRDAARWPSVGDREVAISINLFPVQVNNGQLQAHIDHALASSGLSARRLELEITETIALRPDDSAARSLAGLRERGVRLAFDDFGTGYASLSILQRFPIDRVKIDRSFVRDMLANRSDAAIVRSILLISHNLDLQVIAEGVENPPQADALRGLGCEGAQGFLYAPALAPVEFDRWLAGYRDPRPPAMAATPVATLVDG